jgi:hypothetical protein
MPEDPLRLGARHVTIRVRRGQSMNAWIIVAVALAVLAGEGVAVAQRRARYSTRSRLRSS